MAEVFAFLAVVGGFALILGAFWWLASTVRRRGGSLTSPIDEVYQPNAHRLRFDLQAQVEAGEAVASPEDPFKPRGR